MDFQEPSKPAVLMIEAAGLAITGLLLLVIAYGLQLGIRVITNGTLHASLGVLAFGFLFYVCATFVAVGTRQQPAHPVSLVANVGLHAAFLCLGWLLWRSDVPLSSLALALAFTVVVQGGSYALVRFRQRNLQRLLEQRAAIEDAFLERFFLARSPMQLAIPLGAALGMALGSLAGAHPSTLARHALAGVFALIAWSALLSILAGSRMLARDLVTAHGEARVLLKVGGSAKTYSFHVCSPEPSSSNIDLGVAAAGIAAHVRRVLLANQLLHMMFFALSLLVLGELEFARASVATAALALAAVSLLIAPVPYYIGQRRTNARVLLPLSGQAREEARARLGKDASSVASLDSWAAALIAPATLAAAAYSCAEPIIHGLLR